MKNSYYKPEDNEFHEGFEYEISDYDEDLDQFNQNWNTRKFDIRYGLDHDSFHALKDDFIRVKLIDQDDIEDCGWEHIGSGWYNLKEVPGTLGYYMYVRMRIWGTSTFIRAYRYNPAEVKDEEDWQDIEQLFSGEIKNKSILKQIMKLTHIA